MSWQLKTAECVFALNTPAHVLILPTAGIQSYAVSTKSPPRQEKTSSGPSQRTSRTPILRSMKVRVLVWYFRQDSHHFCSTSAVPFCVSGREKKFLSTLLKLNMYLENPLPYELDKNPDATKSSRLFLDGDTLSLADCNLLPKLNIVKVSCFFRVHRVPEPTSPSRWSTHLPCLLIWSQSLLYSTIWIQMWIKTFLSFFLPSFLVWSVFLQWKFWVLCPQHWKQVKA